MLKKLDEKKEDVPGIKAISPVVQTNAQVIVGGANWQTRVTGVRPSYQGIQRLRWNADELLRMRARGWLSNFSIGDTTPDNGVPLVTAFRWDTGVQLPAAHQWTGMALVVTANALAVTTARSLRDPIGDRAAGVGTREVDGCEAGHRAAIVKSETGSEVVRDRGVKSSGTGE